MKRVVVNKALIRILCFFVIGLLFINFVGSIQLTSEQTAWYNSQSALDKLIISRMPPEVYKELWGQKDNTARDNFLKEYIGKKGVKLKKDGTKVAVELGFSTLNKFNNLVSKSYSLFHSDERAKRYNSFLEGVKSSEGTYSEGFIGKLGEFVFLIISVFMIFPIIGDLFVNNGIDYLNFFYMFIALLSFKFLYWASTRTSFGKRLFIYVSKVVNGYIWIIFRNHIYFLYLIIISFYFLAFSVTVGGEGTISFEQNLLGLMLRITFGIPIAPMVAFPNLGVVARMVVFVAWIFVCIPVGIRLLRWVDLLRFDGDGNLVCPIYNYKGAKFLLFIVPAGVIFIIFFPLIFGFRRFRMHLIYLELKKAKGYMIEGEELIGFGDANDQKEGKQKINMAHSIISYMGFVCEENGDTDLFDRVHESVFGKKYRSSSGTREAYEDFLSYND